MSDVDSMPVRTMMMNPRRTLSARSLDTFQSKNDGLFIPGFSPKILEFKVIRLEAVNPWEGVTNKAKNISILEHYWLDHI